MRRFPFARVPGRFRYVSVLTVVGLGSGSLSAWQSARVEVKQMARRSCMMLATVVGELDPRLVMAAETAAAESFVTVCVDELLSEQSPTL